LLCCYGDLNDGNNGPTRALGRDISELVQVIPEARSLDDVLQMMQYELQSHKKWIQ